MRLQVIEQFTVVGELLRLRPSVLRALLQVRRVIVAHAGEIDAVNGGQRAYKVGPARPCADDGHTHRQIIAGVQEAAGGKGGACRAQKSSSCDGHVEIPYEEPIHVKPAGGSNHPTSSPGQGLLSR